MSIITKRGDGGATDCLYGRRISKTDPLIDAIGDLDELNAWIGYAASETAPIGYGSWGVNYQHKYQKNLVSIMGELSAGPENFEKYKTQFHAIGDAEITSIEHDVEDIEKYAKFTDWQTPHTPWDIACRVCRRAERSLRKYHEYDSTGKILEAANVRKEVLIYINRVSDLLWIFGRR